MQPFSTLIKKPEPLKKPEPVAQTKQEITPVKSSLPPVNQAASASQMAQATQDNRFKTALTERYKTDVQRQQNKVAAEQEKLRTQQLSAPKVQSTNRIQDLLTTINTSTDPNEVASATAEYQKLMNQQAPTMVQPSEEMRQAQANLAALSRLSGGGLVSAYATGPTSYQTMALQGNGGMSNALLAAKQGAMEAERQAAISDQALALEEARAAQLRGLSGTAASAAQSSFLRDLSVKAESDKKLKDDALSRVKEGIFLGKPVSQSDLDLLGITKAQASEMMSFDLGEIEGLVGEDQALPTDLSGLESVIKNIRDTIPEQQMTQEQRDLVNYYDKIQSGFTREADLTSDYAFATPEEEAKINALRRLTGQSDVSKEAIGGGREAGKILPPSVFREINEFEKQRKQAADEEFTREAARIAASGAGTEEERLGNRVTNIKNRLDNFNELYDAARNRSLSADEVYRYLTRYGTEPFGKAGASHMKNVYQDVLLRESKSGNPNAERDALKEVVKILQGDLTRARSEFETYKQQLDYNNKTTKGFTKGLTISNDSGGSV